MRYFINMYGASPLRPRKVREASTVLRKSDLEITASSTTQREEDL